jgi:hypothetical protein
MRWILRDAVLAAVLVAVVGTGVSAAAASTSNGQCLDCHSRSGTQHDPAYVLDSGTTTFTVGAVEFASACSKCHWVGTQTTPQSSMPYTTTSHNYGSTTACSGTGCHAVSYGSVNGMAVPKSLVTSMGSYFYSASSYLADSATLHRIHFNPRWPAQADVVVGGPISGLAPTKKALYSLHCASCHAAASCDDCHTSSQVSPDHALHTTATVTSVVGHGTPIGDQSVAGTSAAAQTCITATCHSAAAIRSPATYDNTDPRVIKSGPWALVTGNQFCAGSAIKSNVATATVSLVASGSVLSVYGFTLQTGGYAVLKVDSSTVATVSCYSATQSGSTELFHCDLAPGSHTITVANANIAGKGLGKYVTLDYFAVSGESYDKFKTHACIDCHVLPSQSVNGIDSKDRGALHGYDMTQHADLQAAEVDTTFGQSCSSCHTMDVMTIHSNQMRHGQPTGCAVCHSKLPGDSMAAADWVRVNGAWDSGGLAHKCEACHGNSAAATSVPSLVTSAKHYRWGHDIYKPVTLISGDLLVWKHSPATFSLTATDEAFGSGVVSTHYTLDGGTDNAYSAPVSISKEGTTVVSYWSVDSSVNVGVAGTSYVLVDDHAPTVVGTATTPANSAGWFRSDVTVHFTATDALSGVKEISSDVTLSSESANLSASGSATDVAGNRGTTTVPDIRIDKTAPVTASDAADTYTGTATVTFTPTDDLSGVAHTYYSFDGGVTSREGTRVVTARAGLYTLTFWSVDLAGNVGTRRTVSYEQWPDHAIYIHNALCRYCHVKNEPGGNYQVTDASSVDFGAAPVDFSTVCAKCHWVGDPSSPTASHPYTTPSHSYANSNCSGSGCHAAPFGRLNGMAVPHSYVASMNAYFYSATSYLDANGRVDAEALHKLHSNPAWPAGADIRVGGSIPGQNSRKGLYDLRCPSCHKSAACSACHGDVGHTGHAPGVADALVVGSGTDIGDQSVISTSTGQSCTGGDCHPVAVLAAGATFDSAGTTITKTGAWSTVTDVRFQGGSAIKSNANPGWVSASVGNVTSGSEFSYYAFALPTGGKAFVRVDGNTVATVSCYAAAQSGSKELYRGRLSAGDHTISVVNAQSAGAGGGKYVTFDSIVFYPTPYETKDGAFRPTCGTFGCHIPNVVWHGGYTETSHTVPAALWNTGYQAGIVFPDFLGNGSYECNDCHSSLLTRDGGGGAHGAMACSGCHQNPSYAGVIAGRWSSKLCAECHTAPLHPRSATVHEVSAGTCAGTASECHTDTDLARLHSHARGGGAPSYRGCRDCHDKDSRPAWPAGFSSADPCGSASNGCHKDVVLAAHASHVHVLDKAASADAGCTGSGAGCHGTEARPQGSASSTDTGVAMYSTPYHTGCFATLCHRSVDHTRTVPPSGCLDCHDGSFQGAPVVGDVSGHYRQDLHGFGVEVLEGTVTAGGSGAASCVDCHRPDVARDLSSIHLDRSVECTTCHNQAPDAVAGDWVSGDKACSVCHTAAVLADSSQHATAAPSVTATWATADDCGNSGSACHSSSDLHAIHKDAAGGCDLQGCHDFTKDGIRPTTLACGATLGGCHPTIDPSSHYVEASHTVPPALWSAAWQGVGFDYGGAECETCHSSVLSVDHPGFACADCHGAAAPVPQAVIAGGWVTKRCVECHTTGTHATFGSEHAITAVGCSDSGPDCHGTQTDLAGLHSHDRAGRPPAFQGCADCHTTKNVRPAWPVGFDPAYPCGEGSTGCHQDVGSDHPAKVHVLDTASSVEAGCVDSGDGCHGAELRPQGSRGTTDAAVASYVDPYHPNNTCTDGPCHTSSTHRAMYPPLACTSCHGASLGGTDATFTGAPLVASVAAHYGEDTHTTPAESLTETLGGGGRASASCADCHTGGGSTDLKWLHADVGVGCSECHNQCADAVNGGWVDGGKTCDVCHNATVLPLSVRHEQTIPSVSATWSAADGCGASGYGCHPSAELHLQHRNAAGGCTLSGCHQLDRKGVKPHVYSCGPESGGCHTREGVDYHTKTTAIQHAVTAKDLPAYDSCFSADCHSPARTLAAVHATGTATGGRFDPPYASSCNLCHKNSSVTRIDWSSLSAEPATQAAGCDNCHNPNTRHRYWTARHSLSASSTPCLGSGCHVSDIVPLHGSRCSVCHNSVDNWTKKADCTTCHADKFSPESKHYNEASHTPAPSSLTATMGGGGTAIASCADCHTGGGSVGLASQHVGNAGAACGACHGANPSVVASGWASKACTECHNETALPGKAQHAAAAPLSVTATWTAGDGCGAISLGCHQSSELHVLHKNAPGGCGLTGCHDFSKHGIKPTLKGCGANKGQCHTDHTATNHGGVTGNESPTHTVTAESMAATIGVSGSFTPTDALHPGGYYSTSHACSECHSRGLISAHTSNVSTHTISCTAGGTGNKGCHNQNATINSPSVIKPVGTWDHTCAACHAAPTGPAYHDSYDVTQTTGVGHTGYCGTWKCPDCHSSLDLRVLHASTTNPNVGCSQSRDATGNSPFDCHASKDVKPTKVSCGKGLGGCHRDKDDCMHELHVHVDAKAQSDASGCTNSGPGCHGTDLRPQGSAGTTDNKVSDYENPYHPWTIGESTASACFWTPCHSNSAQHQALVGNAPLACLDCHGSNAAGDGATFTASPWVADDASGHYVEATHTALTTASAYVGQIDDASTAYGDCSLCHYGQLRSAHTTTSAGINAVSCSSGGLSGAGCHNTTSTAGYYDCADVVTSDFDSNQNSPDASLARRCTACHIPAYVHAQIETTHQVAIDGVSNVCASSGVGCHSGNLTQVHRPTACNACHARDIVARTRSCGAGTTSCHQDYASTVHRLIDGNDATHTARSMSGTVGVAGFFQGSAYSDYQTCSECHRSELLANHSNTTIGNIGCTTGGAGDTGCHNQEEPLNAAGVIKSGAWDGSCLQCHLKNHNSDDTTDIVGVGHTGSHPGWNCTYACHKTTDLRVLHAKMKYGTGCSEAADGTRSPFACHAVQSAKPQMRTCGQGNGGCHQDKTDMNHGTAHSLDVIGSAYNNATVSGCTGSGGGCHGSTTPASYANVQYHPNAGATCWDSKCHDPSAVNHDAPLFDDPNSCQDCHGQGSSNPTTWYVNAQLVSNLLAITANNGHYNEASHTPTGLSATITAGGTTGARCVDCHPAGPQVSGLNQLYFQHQAVGRIAGGPTGPGFSNGFETGKLTSWTAGDYRAASTPTTYFTDGFESGINGWWTLSNTTYVTGQTSTTANPANSGTKMVRIAARANTSTAMYFYRRVGTTTATVPVNLRAYFRTSGLVAGDVYRVRYSSNGTTWTDVASGTANVDSFTPVSSSALPTVANCYVRFELDPVVDASTTRYFFIDDASVFDSKAVYGENGWTATSTAKFGGSYGARGVGATISPAARYLTKTGIVEGNCQSVSVKYNLNYSSIEPGEFTMETYDGSTWTERATYAGTSSGWTTETVSGLSTSTVGIRFKINGDEANDLVYIDNVTVTPIPFDYTAPGVNYTCVDCHSFNARTVDLTQRGGAAWDGACGGGSAGQGCHNPVDMPGMALGHRTAAPSVVASTSQGCAAVSLGCHGNDLHAIHKGKAGSKVTCASCHTYGIEASKPQKIACGKGGDSGCHESYTAASHAGFTGTDTSHTAGSQQATDTSYKGVACQSCHSMALSTEHSKPFSSGATTCTACHNNPASVQVIRVKWLPDRTLRSACTTCHAGANGIPVPHTGDFTAEHSPVSTSCAGSGAGCHGTDISSSSIHSGGCLRCHSQTPSGNLLLAYDPTKKTCGNGRNCHNGVSPWGSYDATTLVHTGSRIGTITGDDTTHTTLTTITAYAGSVNDSSTQYGNCSLCHSAGLKSAHKGTTVGAVGCVTGGSAGQGCHNSSVLASSSVVVKSNYNAGLPTARRCTACHASIHDSIVTTHQPSPDTTTTGCLNQGPGCHAGDLRTVHKGTACGACHVKDVVATVRACGAGTGGCHGTYTNANHNGVNGSDAPTHTAIGMDATIGVTVRTYTDYRACSECHATDLVTAHTNTSAGTIGCVTGGTGNVGCHNEATPINANGVIKPSMSWDRSCGQCHGTAGPAYHPTVTSSHVGLHPGYTDSAPGPTRSCESTGGCHGTGDLQKLHAKKKYGSGCSDSADGTRSPFACHSGQMPASAMPTVTTCGEGNGGCHQDKTGNNHGGSHLALTASSRECVECHQTPRLQDLHGGNCNLCHAGPYGNLTELASDECVDCHNAEIMGRDYMDAGNSATMGERMLPHYASFAQTHTVSGWDTSDAIANTSGFACTDCHPSDLWGAHSIGMGSLDTTSSAKYPDNHRCTTCHSLFGSLTSTTAVGFSNVATTQVGWWTSPDRGDTAGKCSACHPVERTHDATIAAHNASNALVSNPGSYNPTSSVFATSFSTSTTWPVAWSRSDTSNVTMQTSTSRSGAAIYITSNSSTATARSVTSSPSVAATTNAASSQVVFWYLTRGLGADDFFRAEVATDGASWHVVYSVDDTPTVQGVWKRVIASGLPTGTKIVVRLYSKMNDPTRGNEQVYIDDLSINRESTRGALPPSTPAEEACSQDVGCHDLSDIRAIHSLASTVVAGDTRTSCRICHPNSSSPLRMDCTSSGCHPNTNFDEHAQTAFGTPAHHEVSTFATFAPSATACAGCHDDSLAGEHRVYGSVATPGGIPYTLSNRSSCALCHGYWAPRTPSPQYSAGSTSSPVVANVIAAIQAGDTRCTSCHTSSNRYVPHVRSAVETTTQRQFDPMWSGHRTYPEMYGSRTGTPTSFFYFSGVASLTVSWKLPTGTWLASGWTTTSMVGCDDCHGAITGAAGPHGSSMKASYATSSSGVPFDNSYTSGALTLASNGKMSNSTNLCYKCHSNMAVSLNTAHGTGNHNGSKCIACHSAIPHAWKRPRLLVYKTDPAPYRTSSAALTGITARSYTGAGPGQTNCGASCSNHSTTPLSPLWP